MLDEATKRGSVSHDQNSFSGGNVRRDRLQPEGHRSLDEVLEGLVEWEVRLRDGGEQLAVGWQLKRANLKPPSFGKNVSQHQLVGRGRGKKEQLKLLT